ncbi:hypothetical protein INR49_013867 [Caranx melampygus]|nr:hypothetical protein INR49_013867 [Caranx melampygus]
MLQDEALHISPLLTVTLFVLRLVFRPPDPAMSFKGLSRALVPELAVDQQPAAAPASSHLPASSQRLPDLQPPQRDQTLLLSSPSPA